MERLYAHIGALDSSLQEAPKVLDIISVNGPANVLTASMADDFVRIEVTQIVITARFISRDQGNLIRDSLFDKPAQRIRGRIFDDLTDNISLAAYRSDDSGFASVRSAAAVRPPRPITAP